jgi:integrase
MSEKALDVRPTTLTPVVVWRTLTVENTQFMEASPSPITIAPDSMAPTAIATPALSLQPVIDQARQFFQQTTASATSSAYQSDWRAFDHWCREHALPPLPAAPEVVACYLTACAMRGLKVTTIRRHLSAINAEHRAHGLESPTCSTAVKGVMHGIQRTLGTPPEPVDALLTEDIQRMVAGLPNALQGQRDAAILLIGFAGAFRRSELVALNCDDLHLRPEGYLLRIPRSKTDQHGQGRWVGIPYGEHPDTCPVLALQRWLTASGINDGAVFRGVNRHGHLASARLSKRSIADIVKRAAKAAGLDPHRYSGHSLRSGHCTSAARAGVPERIIMRQTGHHSERMVRHYVQQSSVFTENSAKSLGL